MATTKSVGLLIVGHGSRDPDSNLEFEAFVAVYQKTRPDLRIAFAYVELAQPGLDTALTSLADQVQTVAVLPLFLFAAGHVKNDIPLALARIRVSHPEVQFVAASALGVHPILVDLVLRRATTTLSDESARREKTAVIVVGRGASDPDANGDFCKLVRLMGEGQGLGWVVPAFIGITRPSVAETLELTFALRPARVVVVPYSLFAGKLIHRLKDQVEAFSQRQSWIPVEVVAHLGADPSLFQLLDDRLKESLDEGRPLPCDNCQYRTPVSGVTQNVGGLRALLWSLRHGFTHTQAKPVHSHRPLAKHVLVCGNADCAQAGSVAVLDSLRRLVKQAGLNQEIRVTRTSCMGHCGEGPTVAVYPDGVWYRKVQADDCEELVQEHLLQDKLVSRIVGEIMQ